MIQKNSLLRIEKIVLLLFLPVAIYLIVSGYRESYPGDYNECALEEKHSPLKTMIGIFMLLRLSYILFKSSQKISTAIERLKTKSKYASFMLKILLGGVCILVLIGNQFIHDYINEQFVQDRIQQLAQDGVRTRGMVTNKFSRLYPMRKRSYDFITFQYRKGNKSVSVCHILADNEKAEIGDTLYFLISKSHPEFIETLYK